MLPDHYIFYNMKCILILSFVVIAGLAVTDACDPVRMEKCRHKFLSTLDDNARGNEKELVCKFLDNLRECFIKDADCPEDSIKEAFELILPGLREKYDVRCSSCTSQASLVLTIVTSVYLLMMHK